MPFSIAITPAEVGKGHLPAGQIFSAFSNSVTPITLHFDALLISVHAYIQAEIELDGAGYWDLSCRAWRDDADTARALMQSRIVAMRALGVVALGDKPLKRMSILLSIMLKTTSSFDLARARGLLTSHAILFDCPRDAPVAERVNTLLRRGRSLIDALVALPSYTHFDDKFDLAAEVYASLPDSHEIDDFGVAA